MRAEITCGRREGGPPATFRSATATAARPDSLALRPARDRSPLASWRELTATLRSACARHPYLRFLQIIPVALILWGTDWVDRFRSDAAQAGIKNAVVVDGISRQLGGWIAAPMNDWLAAHPIASLASAWYYMMLQGALTGVVGVILIWRRAPHFSLHRNALIACNLVALVVFWLYPVAPPRMLPGYHDIAASASPFFSGMLEGKAADEFASLPSLHVAWAIWVAIALSALLRRPWLRALVWLYPLATAADVLATANHYLLDVITAPGVVVIAYAVVASPGVIRRDRSRPVQPAPR
jgi:PAP2 superfamily